MSKLRESYRRFAKAFPLRGIYPIGVYLGRITSHVVGVAACHANKNFAA